VKYFVRSPTVVGVLAFFTTAFLVVVFFAVVFEAMVPPGVNCRSASSRETFRRARTDRMHDH
jgi:hypothetical protein